jgi:hypothetical protein
MPALAEGSAFGRSWEPLKSQEWPEVWPSPARKGNVPLTGCAIGVDDYTQLFDRAIWKPQLPHINVGDWVPKSGRLSWSRNIERVRWHR